MAVIIATAPNCGVLYLARALFQLRYRPMNKIDYSAVLFLCQEVDFGRILIFDLLPYRKGGMAMKPVWKEFLIALFMGLFLPWIVLWIVVGIQNAGTEPAETQTQPPQSEVTEASQSASQLQMYLRGTDGTVTAMEMDEYLVGVVLAEMPADFEQEAQKAQAVVARTFTQKAVVTGGKHGDSSVCTDPACCQAYISEDAYLEKGGDGSAVERVRSAVMATSGYVLTYEGELIEATYFSCSGGSTEDAVAVWGTEFPYLRAVESPGEENAAHYTDTVTFTKSEFAGALGVTLSGSPGSWVGPVTYTAGGGVNTMVIGGKEFKGTQLRSLLGLRSTAFTISAEESAVTIVTKGFGHRVGMSQYGADAMAASGSAYQEILAYYYQGTTLQLTNSGA